MHYPATVNSCFKDKKKILNVKRIENPKNTERGRNAIPPRREFIFPTHLFFYFPFLTQLQTAFIIGTSYAIAKLVPKTPEVCNFITSS